MAETFKSILTARTSAHFKFVSVLCMSIYLLVNAMFIAMAAVLWCLLFPFGRLRRRTISGLLRFSTFFLSFGAFPFFGAYSLSPIRGRENISLSSTVYAVNHIAIIDSIFMIALIPNAGILIKTKYSSYMAIRLMSSIFDFVIIDEKSRDSILAAESRLKNILTSGGNVVIFPEGTRSRNGRLGDFKKLAFSTAMKTDSDVVPVAIKSKFPIWNSGVPRNVSEEINEFSITFLPRICAADCKSASEMSERAFASISSVVNPKFRADDSNSKNNHKK